MRGNEEKANATHVHERPEVRDVFHDHTGLYPKIVVHGHTPVPEAEVMANRVNVDTLAWQSGMLTALVVDGADKRILEMAIKGA